MTKIKRKNYLAKKSETQCERYYFWLFIENEWVTIGLVKGYMTQYFALDDNKFYLKNYTMWRLTKSTIVK